MWSRKISILVLGFSLFCCPVYALDWKTLHERADSSVSEKALTVYKNNPESLEAMYVLGLTYLNEYNTDAAEAIFRKMLEVDLACIEAQWGVAECLRRRRICGQCTRLLSGIIRAYPEFAPAYITAAYNSFIERDFEETARLTYSVIKLGRDKVDATNYVRACSLFAGAKGMIAHFGGPVSKVINGRVVYPYLIKAQKIQPNSAAVLFGLGSYYLLSPAALGRDLAKAEEYLLKAIKADPKFVDVYVRLAQTYKAKGDDKKYNLYIEKALKLDQRSEIALDIKNNTCQFICLK